MEKTNKYEFEDVQQILALLAKILARGMDKEQRKSVIRDILNSEDWNWEADEFRFFQSLLDYYNVNKSLKFVALITDRIQASQALFYQNVGPELSQLKYLVQKIGIHESDSNSRYVFVLLPFANEFFTVYEEVVKPTLMDLGCIVEHADEVQTVDSIIDIVLTRIAKSDFLIADTTGKNPNVFYEIGYAHALGKKVILLAQNAKELPFDVRHWRHIIYNIDQPHVLSKKLKDVALSLLNQENGNP